MGMVLIIPFTTLLVGSFLGAKAAIPALVLSAAPFYARMVEIAFREVNPGVIEAAQAMGASPLRIIFTVLIPEALGPLILGLTFITVSLIDFSAVAGTVGAGGLGHVAMTYGYQRFDGSVMVVTVLILIILVQFAQWIGNTLSKKFLRR